MEERLENALLEDVFQRLGDFLEVIRIDYVAGSTNNASAIDWEERLIEIEQILEEIGYSPKD